MKNHKHRHTVPHKADRIRKRILMRCPEDSHTSWWPAELCEPCAARQKAHHDAVMAYRAKWATMTVAERWADDHRPPGIFVPGCEGCFLGLVAKAFEAGCCCYSGRTKCQTCARQADRSLIHVCERITPEERAYERELAALTVETVQPSREAQERAHVLDHSQGIRVAKRD